MFQKPEELIPGTKTLEKMNADMSNQLGKDLQNAANLLAHPAAGVAAASALGFGLASHSLGVWMGFVAGAAEATQRLFEPVLGDLAGDLDSFADKKESPAKRAEVTAKALIDDSKRLAEKVAKAGAEPAKPASKAKPIRSIAAKPVDVESKPTLKIAAAPVAKEPDPAKQPGPMPEDFRQPVAMARPQTPDDLKAIAGVGPKLEQVLNGLGVWTYAQVAAWTAEEIAWVDDTLGFKGRIVRDDWIGQAAKLAKTGQ